MSMANFNDEIQKRFERYLSIKMGTNLKIKRNPDGTPMIHPFDPSAIEGESYDFDNNFVIHGNLGIVVYLSIDNVKCDVESEGHCFEDVSGYGNFLDAFIDADPGVKDVWPIARVGAANAPDSGGGDGPNNLGVAIGVTICVLIVLSIGVVTQTGRKRKAKGITWFPDGFSIPQGLTGGGSGTKRPRVGQEMSTYPSTMDMSGGYMDGWSDDDPQEIPINKRTRMEPEFSSGQTMVTEYDDGDSRQWTQQHLNAADIRNPDIIGALTPPQGDAASKAEIMNDVDVRGPMGMTPLMIASIRSGGLDTGDADGLYEDNMGDDGTSAVIADLIGHGADPSSQMDKTGENALHLAARYARADAAKKLLEASAFDPNAMDNTGRTPLHAAVAADAQGVFHILLKNRATNLNAKTADGTTPLILAARLAIESMVEQLIEADAEINLADENGRTALHWAAAVNNVDAVNVLLANGANRDAQDSKDETPLYMAAKEGSYQAARALLDHCANRDIQDHMDRLPIHIAQEKMHQDIVELLNEHIPPAPTMAPSAAALHHHSFMGSPPSHLVHSPPSGAAASGGAKPKTKAKRAPRNSTDEIAASETLPRSVGGKKPSVRRKKHDSTSYDQQSLSPEVLGMLLPEPSSQNGHPLAVSHPNLEEMAAGKRPPPPPPPSYEASVVNTAMARSMQALQGGMPGQQGLESQYKGFQQQQQQHQRQQQQQHQQQVPHSRQQSMPVAMGYNAGGSNSNNAGHLSPPHSNGGQQVHSPSALSPHMSSSMIMSPPQSIQSNHSMSSMNSPPQHQQQQQQGPSGPSPVKTTSPQPLQQQAPPPARSTAQLPTSPTHLAAMRGNMQQQQLMQQHQQQAQFGQQFVYPTPPHNGNGQQQQVNNGASNFLTPSPDSPWSSASPQSHSDWSEAGGVHSPPSMHQQQQMQKQQQLHMQQQQMLQQQQQHQQQQQQGDGVLI